MWLFFTMHWFHMYCQSRLSWATVFTNRAPVRLFSFVYRFHMTYHTTSLRKTIITDRALVWLLSFMHRFHMSFHIEILRATIITNRALLYFFSVMYCFQMPLDITPLWGIVITNITSMLLFLHAYHFYSCSSLRFLILDFIFHVVATYFQIGVQTNINLNWSFKIGSSQNRRKKNPFLKDLLFQQVFCNWL